MAVVLTVQGQYDGRQIDKAIRDLEQLKKYGASAAVGIGSAFDRQAAAIKAFGDRVMTTGQSISRAGTTITRGLSIPLAAVGYASIKSAANFQVAMAQTQVATQASGAEMKKLSALAIKLGQDTVFSATDAGNAMLNLAKGGLTKAEIEGGALKSTLDLAAASGIDLAEAASTVTASMNTFGIKAGEVNVAVDALAGAAAASNAEMPDLMMALRQVGQSASMSGLSIQETTGALAAFADKGVIGSDAGTSFKVMLQRLTPQSKEAAVLMKELGMSFFDAAGNTKPLNQIAQELQSGLSGLTEEQRKATLSTIFGTDAIRAANIMYELGGKGVSDYVDATTKSGTAAKFAQARMSGLYGVIEQLRGSIDTALIQNGEALEPTFTAITNAVKDLVNAYSSLSPQMQGFIAKTMLAGVVLGPVIKTVGIFTTGIGATIKTMGTLISVTGKTANAIAAFGTGLVNPRTRLSAFASTAQRVGGIVGNAVLKMAGVIKTGFMAIGRVLMANPWILVVAAIVAAAIVIYKNWDKIKAAFLAGWEFIKDVGGKIVDFFKGWVKLYINIGRFIVEGLWNGIKAAGSWLLDQIKGWASGILDGIKGFFGISSPSKHTEEYGKQIAAGLAVGMNSGTADVTDSSRKVSQAALKAMGLAIGTGGTTVTSKVKDLGAKMAKELAATIKNVSKTASKLRDTIKSGLEDTISNAKDAMQSISDQIFAALDAMREAADNMVQAAADGVDNMKNSYDSALGVLSDLKDQASSYAGQIRDALSGAFSLKDALSSESGTSFLQNLRDQVKKFQAFSGQLTQLRSMGLNESSMQEIIQAGVEQGTQIASAILAGGAGAVSEINQLESIITSEAQTFGNLLSQDKFGTEIAKAQKNLDLASQNLTKANDALAAATASRDALVAQINSVRERTNQILGKNTDALETMTGNLSLSMENMASTIGTIIGLIEGKLSSMSALAGISASAKTQLNALSSTSGTSTVSTKSTGSLFGSNYMDRKELTLTADVMINATTNATPDDIADATRSALLQLAREARYL